MNAKIIFSILVAVLLSLNLVLSSDLMGLTLDIKEFGINLASLALIANLTIAKNIRRLNGADK